MKEIASKNLKPRPAPQESEARSLRERPPIVVVMGHVDHGKTTLLDYIRKTNVAGREAGGITQSIGAYEIEHGGKRITFIDTPGHEAFSAMRSRGAAAADLAILVVAADEGLKPQTQEAIKILAVTKTPFIVALNKIDKPSANIEKVKNELAAAGVALEGYGGNVSYHAISAKTGEGVGELLDLILLATELENLTYDASLPATGYVLEAKLDKRRGIEVAVIIKNGTLAIGEPIGTVSARGKIKILEDFLGERREKLVPSAPALIIGFESLPQAGEEFQAGKGVAELTQAIRVRKEKNASQPTAEAGKPVTLLILKASDAGSLEALSLVIRALPREDRELMILDESVGDITDNDVRNAVASKAMIIGFKNSVSKTAKNLSEIHGVPIVISEIIYELVKTVEDALSGKGVSDVAGELEVLAVFNKERKDKQVVGGRVLQGILRNREPFEILRGREIVGIGRFVNLQTQKKDAHQVTEGNEAGLLAGADAFIEVGDHLIARK